MRQVRDWPQEARQSLRFLAAARFFLPKYLECDADLEPKYQSHLRDSEFQAALEVLEQIGDMHSGYAEEMQFWKELFYAAQHLALSEHAARYEDRIRQVIEMQRLQF